MLSQPDIAALLITLKLAGTTTLILLLLGTPLAWWLATTRSRARSAIEAVIALPLVLPPTVLGFYLLLAFSPDGPIGATTSALG
ncbi:MAG: molybdate transport system permease protein, partial [Kiritimatiellia bacterium]